MAYALILITVGAAASWAYHGIHEDHILYRRAETFFENGSFAEAVPLYERAFRSGYVKPNAVRHLIIACRTTGDMDRAISVLESLRSETEEPAPLLLLGELYAEKGMWEQALSLLKSRESLLADDPGAMMQLADAYRNTGDLPEAIRCYRRALEKRSTWLYGRFRLAEVLAWSKRYEESASLFRSILVDHPEHRASRLFLARVLSWDGRFDEAIEVYQQLLGERT